jgi:hypothetical protein
MAAPTAAACVKKTPAKPEPSTHGPSRRWGSPELAAGSWGSPAATVASGPQGAILCPGLPRGAMTPGPQQRAPGSGGRTDGLRHEPRVGRAGVVGPARWRRARGGVGRDPGRRLAPRTPGPPRHQRHGVGPRLCRGRGLRCTRLKIKRLLTGFWGHRCASFFF